MRINFPHKTTQKRDQKNVSIILFRIFCRRFLHQQPCQVRATPKRFQFILLHILNLIILFSNFAQLHTLKKLKRCKISPPSPSHYLY